MENLSSFEKQLAAVTEIEPDEWDMAMLTESDTEEDTTTTPIADVRELRDCNGKISLHMPKELHLKLPANAKDNGVSLNQFIIYKLAQ